MRPKSSAKPIALVGLMGAGKTAVARVLGERLGASVADLDAMIEATEGCTVAELFAREGEARFRQRERAQLEEVLRAGVRVVACGGGIVLDPANRSLLRERCHVVWLEVSPDEAARRVSGEGEAGLQRPLLAGGDVAATLASLLDARRTLYAEVAHARVATGGRTPEQVADQVLAARAAA